ncbi:toll/interleukin-1 receptor domain-containing protein [Luteimonas sp. MC1782]|uniref:toll/interleukin-1 receptor domain-containing protein n=1 Tax=Luteimonas sp. MC1782 TaxID=2760305 RepID=UPI0015FEEECA|nr:toll/interleukin-1 receptor domain-containing protein [Luteimonas sp. MC1782]MBB1471677.1 toll/interleukin-1 receptor domain-containing protein [Luteimonas sp. MC1782]
MRFRAFLSYSHADAAWARWLLRRLETYRVPSHLVGTQGTHGVIERRLGSFFLDRDELPSAGDLGETIRAALAASDALVVLCSPAAAGSRWVNAEIEAFQDSGRGDRVLCFVVGGEPGASDPAQACFPPMLLRPAANGARVHEPLAADARPEGDGRQRAFLKLVAGLLGVGYDALAQREAQRRMRRMAIVSVASTAGMALALGLAATAYVARNDAQRRQAQAEDILGFMLGDLREKLATVGRLDLMRAVDDKATGYFAALDPRDISDRALEEQARSLAGIGQVRLEGGDHDAAMAAFREAHARSTLLHARAPDSGQRLFDLAQAEFWIGYVALQQGRSEDAGRWLRRYRDSAVRLAAMDRDNSDWQREVAYGHHNLAVLDEAQGRPDEAERALEQELALYRGWLRERPHDTALRAEAANVASWLGTLADRRGALLDAETFQAEQVDGMRRNMADEPDVAEWRVQHLDALLLLAQVQTRRGRWEEARASLAVAAPRAAALARQDPHNQSWQVTLGVTRLLQARLAQASGMAGAAALASDALAIVSRAQRAEPESDRVLHLLATTHSLKAQLALARGDAAAARTHVQDAAALLEPAWRKEHNERLRLLLACNLDLAAEAADMASDDEGARAASLRARDLLLADAGDAPPFDRLDTLVRSLHRLGQDAQARPHVQRLDAAGYVPSRPWPWRDDALATRP